MQIFSLDEKKKGGGGSIIWKFSMGFSQSQKIRYCLVHDTCFLVDLWSVDHDRLRYFCQFHEFSLCRAVPVDSYASTDFAKCTQLRFLLCLAEKVKEEIIIKFLWFVELNSSKYSEGYRNIPKIQQKKSKISSELFRSWTKFCLIQPNFLLDLWKTPHPNQDFYDPMVSL